MKKDTYSFYLSHFLHSVLQEFKNRPKLLQLYKEYLVANLVTKRTTAINRLLKPKSESKNLRQLLSDTITAIKNAGFIIKQEKEFNIYTREHRIHYIIDLDSSEQGSLLRQYAFLSKKPMLVPPKD